MTGIEGREKGGTECPQQQNRTQKMLEALREERQHLRVDHLAGCTPSIPDSPFCHTDTECRIQPDQAVNEPCRRERNHFKQLQNHFI